ncbi:hypothetical protein ABMA27_014628 [Loxostege sticticalis]|uniref:Uncharacterized protein n=1 Tax=Loxostege sticticalis TaxID=481309 RepID=A0ABR3I9P4_LOXSC
MSSFLLGILSNIADSREVPVGSFSARLENIVKNNFRGLLGVIVPILAFTWMPEKNVHYLTVWVLWMWMFWYFLIQPIAIPCTAMIPICILPMCGVMSSLETTKCYFNEGVCLFLLSSMLILLWNNSGLDRRLALCFLTSGDTCQFSGKRMIVKCSMAAYFLSMFSNRLIVTSMITQYAAEGYATLKATFKKSAYEPDFDEIRNIVCNSIQTSSSIGSIAIIHSAYATLLFRAIWLEATPLPTVTEYPEIFNYLEYSAYAVPVSLVMYLVNLLYHLWIFNCVISRRMTHPSRGDLRDLMLKHKTTIPKRMTWHEMQALFFSLAALLILFLRWNRYMNMGWADYNLKTFAPEVPLVK